MSPINQYVSPHSIPEPQSQVSSPDTGLAASDQHHLESGRLQHSTIPAGQRLHNPQSGSPMRMPPNTLSQSISTLKNQLKDQFSFTPKSSETIPATTSTTPLARIHFCVYPGRSALSTGHSFVAIEPIDPQFGAGSIKLGSRSYLGTVALGVAPKGNHTSDRLFNGLTFSAQKTQLRNDTRYIQKPTTKAWTLELFDQAQLTKGLEYINSLALAMNGDPCYIKSINTTHLNPVQVEDRLAHAPQYDMTRNSNYFALDIFQHFCEDEQLPEALLTPNPKLTSKQMWARLQDDFQSSAQPQTLARHDIAAVMDLRRQAPHVIAQTQRLSSLLRRDMMELNAQRSHIQNHLLYMQARYQPPMETVLRELIEGVPEEANIFAQVFADFSQAVEDAAALASQLENPHSYVQLATTVIGSVFDAQSRTTAMNALGSFHKVITTGQRAMDRINDVTQVIPNAPLEVLSFTEDVKAILGPTKRLLQLLERIPDRALLYLETMDTIFEDSGSIFMG